MDRRNYRRIRPSSEILVFLTIPNRMEVVGTLTDLGPEGLAFEYLVLEHTLEKFVGSSCTVSLKRRNDTGSTSLLEDVPGTLIYDVIPNRISRYLVACRRCGLQFDAPLAFNDLEKTI